MHVFTVNFMRFRQTINTNDTVPSIGPKFFQAIYQKKYRKLDVKMNISTRKKESPTASLLVLGVGGGIFIYMIKNGEFYLGGFFQASDQGIFSGGILLGDYFRWDFYRVPSRSLPLD